VLNVAKSNSRSLEEVNVSRRSAAGRRSDGDRRKGTVEEAVAVERRVSQRRKVSRRRQIDPTTCERDYTADEIEFMDAMDAYKRANGRMFPTCSEILEVVRGLGYVKPDHPQTPSSSEAGSVVPPLSSAGVD